MQPSHQKIIELLKNRTMTIEELEEETSLTQDSIRGRISEIRKKYGYDIKKTKGMYRLTSPEKKKIADDIIQWAKNNDLIGRRIAYDNIKKALNISDQEMLDALSELCHRNKLIQLSKESILIQS